MNGAATPLIGHLTLLSLISFGGTPSVLPDIRDFVVGHGWISSQDFANCFAIVQAIPGPNMILLMSFIAWKVGGIPTAILGALATFVPSCGLAFVASTFWDRFHDAAWQQRARRGLAPVTIGLVIAGGYVMARTGDVGWTSAGITVAAAIVVTCTRLNPLWVVAAGGALGAAGMV